MRLLFPSWRVDSSFLLCRIATGDFPSHFSPFFVTKFKVVRRLLNQ